MTKALVCTAFISVATIAGLSAQTDDARATVIARAQVWTATDVGRLDLFRGPERPDGFTQGQEVRCEYSDEALNGRSPKFACIAAGGDELKVKYGESNGEVHGEVAATRLLWALGFGADTMYPVRVLCRGCPPTIGVPTSQPGEQFVERAVVERKLAGREITGGGQEGWSWLELDLIDEEMGGATRAQRDALRLLAVFLQHTDNKPEQQRLVCLDQGESGTGCDRPFMMINDAGLTFGRANLMNTNLVGSVNLEEWERTAVWKDDGRCIGNLPRSLTGTLKDPVISEEGRQFLASLLSALSDDQIRGMFEAARMDLRNPAPRAIDEWVRVFKQKRQEIVERRCDALWPGGLSALFGTGPIKWLQSRSSHLLTMAMNGVSLFGYTRVFLAIGVVLAFMQGFRAGAALLLLLMLNGVLTDGAKAIVASPRPDAMDTQVQNLDAVFTLGDSIRGETPNQSVDSDDGYGFPSGHVAVTTTFLFGIAYLYGWRWVWPVMPFAIAAMALSRIYLGRHFVGDVLGGLGVGVVAATIGFLALTLRRLTRDKRAIDPAVRTVTLAGGCTLLALASGIGAYDAGRFLGLAASILLLVYTGLDHHISTVARTSGTPRLARLGRIVIAAAVFTAVWRVTNTSLDAIGIRQTAEGALIAGALPAFVLLPAPLVLERVAGSIRAAMSSHGPWSPYNNKAARKTGPL